MMSTVDIDVSIGCNVHANAHLGLDNHEAHLQHLFVIIVLIVDGNTIVAANLQPTFGIGNLQMIMGVEHVRIERLLQILQSPSIVEPIDEIAHKQILRGSPVGFAMLHLVNISMVFVSQVVKIDVQGRIAIQGHDGRGQPIVAHHHLQRGNAIADDFMTLGK